MEKKHINTILESLKWTIVKFEDYTFVPYGEVGSGNFSRERWEMNERIRQSRINDIIEAEAAFINFLKHINKER